MSVTISATLFGWTLPGQTLSSFALGHSPRSLSSALSYSIYSLYTTGSQPGQFASQGTVDNAWRHFLLGPVGVYEILASSREGPGMLVNILQCGPSKNHPAPGVPDPPAESPAVPGAASLVHRSCVTPSRSRRRGKTARLGCGLWPVPSRGPLKEMK